MAYAYGKKRALTAHQSTTDLNEAIETPAFGIPNSAALSMSGSKDFENQIPSAEDEADRLSAGITSATPEALKREMGERLGTDFSGVRFHQDPASERRAENMGARAWTQGNDIFFGNGGFDPVIAAHELVHTVQQGAIEGNVSQSAPLGAVQMWPWSKRETPEEKRLRRMNRLFQIQAGLNSGDPKLVSSKDKKWYDKKMKSADADLIQAILRKRDEEGKNLVEHRQSMWAEESEDKRDFDARGTNSAFNMSIYDTLSQKLEKNKNFKSAFKSYQKGTNRNTAVTLGKAYRILTDRTYDESDEGKEEARLQEDSKKMKSRFIYQNYDNIQKAKSGHAANPIMHPLNPVHRPVNENMNEGWVHVAIQNGEANEVLAAQPEQNQPEDEDDDWAHVGVVNGEAKEVLSPKKERKRREQQQREREEAERREREEAERREREEAKRRLREEEERRAQEEAKRKAREEAQRKAREEAERAKREEQQRLEREAELRKALEEREKKEEAASNADRLYKIQAGIYSGMPRLVSDEDRDWYYDTLENHNQYLANEIVFRQGQSKSNMVQDRYADRPKIGGRHRTDEEMDFETGWGQDAFDAEMYDNIISKMREAPGANGGQDGFAESPIEHALKNRFHDKNTINKADRILSSARKEKFSANEILKEEEANSFDSKLSKRIADLEKNLGHPLDERSRERLAKMVRNEGKDFSPIEMEDDNGYKKQEDEGKNRKKSLREWEKRRSSRYSDRKKAYKAHATNIYLGETGQVHGEEQEKIPEQVNNILNRMDQIEAGKKAGKFNKDDMMWENRMKQNMKYAEKGDNVVIQGINLYPELLKAYSRRHKKEDDIA